ncbi:N-acetylglucosamine kinase [Paenibacillus terrigena]|uniref:N-acetylglucosamine kinase n=1 Tax=Paenibacillus terrigena TaxID=369333 RepID=UPI00037B7653|nr:BadF/BadG/BcrA/BcrD ATPase family protein [Paenibacillus terrigena]
MLLLGIDGGQTSTKSCLYDHENGICLFASGPPIDHMLTFNGQVKTKQAIQQSLQALLVQAKLIRKVDMAFASISGVHKEHEELIKSWIAECVQVDAYMIEGDVKANLSGASNGKNDGVLIIAGGGSIGYYFEGRREFVAGGYGHILGDEGSAYWIGLQSIKAGIRDSESRGPKTVLGKQILDHFGEESFWGIKKRIHADKIQRSDMAQLSLLVERAAADGDEVARDILQRAGEELGGLAVSVLQQARAYDSTLKLDHVYMTGGVVHSERVVASLKDTVHRYDAAVRISKPQYPPVVGALILSAQALQVRMDMSIVNLALQGDEI